MRPFLIIFLLLKLYFPCAAQQEEEDSVRNLDEVIIKTFGENRDLRNTTSSVKIIERNNADRYTKTSLVNGFNTVAGVRMEERSPGSYRINIRGSSLRSPFGVRNVKVYWNDIPVTDAGGNTYFNQFAWNNFSYIEIFKGPASSMYGAGTGGLILLNNLDRWSPGASLEYVGGSYSLNNVFASVRFGKKENRNQISYAHNGSDGYRMQTNMRRDNFSWISRMNISAKQELTASVLYNDMYYQTPGALTLAEYKANPKQARPAGGGFPSAVNAHAAIFQKNLTAGISNTYHFSTSFQNTTVLYGTYAQIKNPAIRNYERRKEPGYGARTSFIYKKKETDDHSGYQLIAGSEFQQGSFNTQVSKNRNGDPDTLQTNDDIDHTTYNVFLQADLTILKNWFFNAGISVNRTKVRFTRLSNYPVLSQKRNYQNEIAPRISMMKRIADNFSVKGTISRGFSPPSISELLPSTGVISTDLEAEYGWNYEMTLQTSLLKRKINIELTAFYFKLNKALVQRRDMSGADYFINAGDIKEKGLEAHADYIHVARSNSFLDQLYIQTDLTFSHFRYGNFVRGSEDYSGKTVPSVPAGTFSALADIKLHNGIYTDLTYYAASLIYLNDANSAAANAYHLFGARLGWKKQTKKMKDHSYRFNFYAGADNLLNEQYSLGNDINAAGGRYYNAAPRRNYYAGISIISL